MCHRTLLVLKHVAAVMSGASVGLAALLGYVLGGRSVMVVTSLLGIFHFGHMVQAAAHNSEPLYGLLVLGVLLGALRTHTNGWLLGALAGCTSLIRAEFLLCAALLAIWLAFDRPGSGTTDGSRSISCGLVLALLPTTILDWRGSTSSTGRVAVACRALPGSPRSPVTAPSASPTRITSAPMEDSTGICPRSRRPTMKRPVFSRKVNSISRERLRTTRT